MRTGPKRISKAAFDRIVATCENPPPPTEKLRELVASVKARYPNIMKRLDDLE